jgi:hypothetical protein
MAGARKLNEKYLPFSPGSFRMIDIIGKGELEVCWIS